VLLSAKTKRANVQNEEKLGKAGAVKKYQELFADHRVAALKAKAEQAVSHHSLVHVCVCCA
jgi:hypothetical protein